MRKTTIEWSKPGTNLKNIGLVLGTTAILYAVMVGIDAVVSMFFV